MHMHTSFFSVTCKVTHLTHYSHILLLTKSRDICLHHICLIIKPISTMQYVGFGSRCNCTTGYAEATQQSNNHCSVLKSRRVRQEQASEKETELSALFHCHLENLILQQLNLSVALRQQPCSDNGRPTARALDIGEISSTAYVDPC